MRNEILVNGQIELIEIVQAVQDTYKFYSYEIAQSAAEEESEVSDVACEEKRKEKPTIQQNFYGPAYGVAGNVAGNQLVNPPNLDLLEEEEA